MAVKNVPHIGNMIIAIDGPAGAGKSTVAQKLARRLDLRYLDTGAMYRALTLKALRSHLDLDDEDKLASMAADMDLHMEYAYRRIPPYRVLMEGEDVTAAIRSREVSAHVSRVSSLPCVRKEMVRKQRSLAAGGGMIVEGRDVGTVVFPQADMKFYITASVKERARRRHREMKKDGYDVSLHTIQQEMIRRDNFDSTRKYNPLKRAPDAELVDTTGENVSQVVGKLLSLVTERAKEAGEAG
ncbi:MAG: (d)CMP kinase [Actinobacteria bacterium]|nr:MAG: (d)CMP kinase [Actinomycetota bacterium]